MSKEIIKLDHIDVTFHQKKREISAVKNVTIHINEGDIYGIVGYSGAGKSTLVRVINLLQVPTAGTITVDGDVIYQDQVTLNAAALRQKRRDIGMIFQHFNLMAQMTAAENVAFALKHSDLSKEQKAEKVAKLLELVGLSDRADNYPAQLSGGQKQRVAIAGIIALRPKIIILDEATSMLDPEGRLELIRTVREVKERYGLTVISITHDLEEVSLSDRVILFEKGKATLDLTPRELFSRDDLDEIGLEEPFANRLRSMLHQKGFPVGETYQTEGELEKLLWELL